MKRERSVVYVDRDVPGERRVRDELKDGVAVAAASVGASVAVVMAATLLMKLAG